MSPVSRFPFPVMFLQTIHSFYFDKSASYQTNQVLNNYVIQIIMGLDYVQSSCPNNVGSTLA